MFALGDPVERDEALAVLGREMFEHASTARLIIQDDESWVCPFKLELVNELYLFSDYSNCHPDSVMSVGPTTELLARASYPQADIEDALEVGCGSGVLSLLLAGCTRRVVATELNPRALCMARLNAAFNGICNVDFRLGDLYGPAEGERFDLIVAQPPFCALPAECEPVLYIHGGTRGDELALRIAEGAAPHLKPAGMAFVLSDFPGGGPVSLADRVRGVVRESQANVLLAVNTDRLDPQTHGACYAGVLAQGDDHRFWAAHKKLSNHLEQQGVEHIRQAVLVISTRSMGDKGWTFEIECPPDRWQSLHRSGIDRALEVVRLRQAGTEALMRRSVRWGRDAILRQQRRLEGSADEVIEVDSNEVAVAGPAQLSEQGLAILSVIVDSPDVRTALDRISEETGHPPEVLLEAIAEELWAGLLCGALNASK